MDKQDKFKTVVETLTMTELELGEYCRANSIYREQLIEWKALCIDGNDQKNTNKDNLNVKLKKPRKA